MSVSQLGGKDLKRCRDNLRPEQLTGSPLDVEGIDLDVTTDEIVQSIAEGRRYSS